MPEEDTNFLCIICNKRPAHGYVNGTGEYLSKTCLPCHRRPTNRHNIIQGGNAKRGSRRPGVGNNEDR